jgi:hypothetical protein
MIYLTHPYHGAKHALSDIEAAADEKQGWQRGEQTKAVICEVPSAPVIDTQRDDLARQWETKFGKKPHHKKSAATLRKELDG